MVHSVVDSSVVLWGQTLMYTAYCLLIISLIAWFARRITRPAGDRAVTPKMFYGWVGFLAVLGVSLHLFTYNTIPWVKADLHGGDPVASYALSVGDHQWQLPQEPIEVPCGQLVEFAVTSTDLTYGFGLFRDDNSMVTQMQVVPGRANNLLWTFETDGSYTIRSTEYSGPKGDQMIVPDAVRVTGCGTSQASTEGGTR